MSSGKNQFKNMIKILKKIEEENSDTWPSHESTLFFRHCMTRSIFSEEKQKGGEVVSRANKYVIRCRYQNKYTPKYVWYGNRGLKLADDKTPSGPHQILIKFRLGTNQPLIKVGLFLSDSDQDSSV